MKDQSASKGFISLWELARIEPARRQSKKYISVDPENQEKIGDPKQGCFLTKGTRVRYALRTIASVLSPKYLTYKIVIPGNPGEGRGRPGIQDFQGILDSGFRRNDG